MMILSLDYVHEAMALPWEVSGPSFEASFLPESSHQFLLLVSFLPGMFGPNLEHFVELS